MALSATVDIDIRKSASDNNGGGFNIASGGTDYSLQTNAQVAIDNSTITTSITTNVITFTGGTYTVLAGDVGNLVQMLTGTNVTAGFYEITSVGTGLNGTWTVDRNVVTSGTTTNATGNMGGSLLTLGKAGSVPIVSGDRIWLKYNASAFATANSSSNVAGGRISITVGTATSPVLIRGYDVTHGDQTANRPTVQAGVNMGSNALIGMSSAAVCNVENLILDGNRTNFTSTRGLQLGSTGNCFHRHLKITSFNSVGIQISGVHNLGLIDIEVTDCSTTVAAINNTVATNIFMDGCYIHDNAVDGISNGSTGLIQTFRCIFDTNANKHIVNLGIARLFCTETDFYGASSFGIDMDVDSIVKLIDCIFENNGGYGLNLDASGVADQVYMYGCGFYNNTGGNYDSTKILTANVISEINNTTGSFFTDAANADFSLNNLINQGRLARAAGWPTLIAGTATTNYSDLGAAQHADATPPIGKNVIITNIGTY